MANGASKTMGLGNVSSNFTGLALVMRVWESRFFAKLRKFRRTDLFVVFSLNALEHIIRELAFVTTKVADS